MRVYIFCSVCMHVYFQICLFTMRSDRLLYTCPRMSMCMLLCCVGMPYIHIHRHMLCVYVYVYAVYDVFLQIITHMSTYIYVYAVWESLSTAASNHSTYVCTYVYVSMHTLKLPPKAFGGRRHTRYLHTYTLHTCMHTFTHT